MAKTKRTDGLNKFQRYREEKRRKGMKLLRIWVPDPRNAQFRKEIARQAKSLRGNPEEAETLRFIEAAFDWPAE